MIHTGQVLRSEDQTRNLNDQIAELQVRVAFPHHWSSGEHEQHVEKLRQLNFQKRLLADYGQNSPADPTFSQHQGAVIHLCSWTKI